MNYIKQFYFVLTHNFVCKAIRTNILSNNYLFEEKVYNYHRFLINKLKRNNFIHTFKPADPNKNTYKIHVLTQQFGTYVATYIDSLIIYNEKYHK